MNLQVEPTMRAQFDEKVFSYLARSFICLLHRMANTFHLTTSFFGIVTYISFFTLDLLQSSFARSTIMMKNIRY